MISGISAGIPWWAAPNILPLTSSSTPPPPSRWREPELRFHTLEAGRRTQEWLPLRIAVSDGSGNGRTTELYSRGNTRGRVLFDGLCRFEPTWKCELDLIRRVETQAPPDRRWKVRIPISGKGRARELRHQYRKAGFALDLIAVAGTGSVALPDGTMVVNRQPTVQVEPEADSHASLVGLIVYPEGRRPGIRAGASLYGPAPEPAFVVRPEISGMTGVFQLPVPAGTRWVDAEFGIYDTRKITILAQPPPR